ncbi:MAG: DUF2975 domain-containing protein [Flavobacterium sp.]|uniref:DUF2975 domain-containing protein n=1 Tax=Flavobacterium sp. TaxID=239 RepID=UPI0011F8FB58|nr:DUF2975 domain-containing protein [Flavobacterium sp.]RZJ68528.1 MAG: DUF2975 domain-containing protein [Flavobacterium sp.]
MKKLNLLKTLLDLFFFFSIFAVIGIFILGPIAFFNGEDLPLKIKGQEIIADNWGARLLIVTSAISSLLFVYAIFLFRKNVHSLVKREIFTEVVIANFKRIGWCLIASTLLGEIPLFFYNMINRNHLGLQFGTGGFDSMLLSIALGLFFMVLSEIFKIGKNLKEENDLTL